MNYLEELTSVVIETLAESEFTPGHHEAYCFVYSTHKFQRLGDFFQKMLDKLDWEYIENCVANLKNGQSTNNQD